MKANTLADFVKFIDRSDLFGCWLWTGPADPHGYGKIWLNGRRQFAHRIAYSLAFHEWDGSGCVLHRCDVPACVNPTHLFIGTRADNNADRDRKGRNIAHTGAANGRAKLTAEEVEAIRSEPLSQRQAALKYGVSPHIIWLVRQRKTWQHI